LKTASILPEVDHVGNGFISVVWYQSQGDSVKGSYSMIEWIRQLPIALLLDKLFKLENQLGD
jgi:hypothetical protein